MGLRLLEMQPAYQACTQLFQGLLVFLCILEMDDQGSPFLGLRMSGVAREMCLRWNSSLYHFLLIITALLKQVLPTTEGLPGSTQAPIAFYLEPYHSFWDNINNHL